MAVLRAFADVTEEHMAEIDGELERLAAVEHEVGIDLIDGYHKHEQGGEEEARSIQSRLESAKSLYEKLHEFLEENPDIDEPTFEAKVKPLIKTTYFDALLALDLRKDLDSTNSDIEDLITALDNVERVEGTIARLEKEQRPGYEKKIDGEQEKLAKRKEEVSKVEAKIRSPLQEGVNGEEKTNSLVVTDALMQKIETHYILGELRYLTGVRTGVNADPLKRAKHCAEADYVKVTEEAVALFEILDGLPDHAPTNGMKERRIYCVRAVYLAGMAHHRLAHLYEAAQMPLDAYDRELHKNVLSGHKTNANGWLGNVRQYCKEYGLNIDEVLKTPLERKEYAKATGTS